MDRCSSKRSSWDIESRSLLCLACLPSGSTPPDSVTIKCPERLEGCRTRHFGVGVIAPGWEGEEEIEALVTEEGALDERVFARIVRACRLERPNDFACLREMLVGETVVDAQVENVSGEVFPPSSLGPSFSGEPEPDLDLTREFSSLSTLSSSSTDFKTSDRIGTCKSVNGEVANASTRVFVVCEMISTSISPSASPPAWPDPTSASTEGETVGGSSPP